MPKDNLLALGEAPFVAEPGRYFFPCNGIRYGLRAFANEVQFAFAGAVTHPREVVGDDPESRHAAQAIVPHERFVAIHLCQELLTPGALQGVLNLPGAIQRVLYGPNRGDARVHHGDAILEVCEGLKMQPFDELLAIRRIENIFEVVLAAGAACATGNGHEM